MRRSLSFSALTLAAVLAACSGGSSVSKQAAPSAGTGPPTSGPTSGTSMPPAACAPATTSGPGNQKVPEVNPPGDIPDDQAFVTFSPPGGGYSVKVPEGWARTDAGGTVSFTDKFNTIHIELIASPVAPTVASARSQEVPALRSHVRCFEEGMVTTVTRRAGPVVLVTYRAGSFPDPVTSKVIRKTWSGMSSGGRAPRP